MKLDQVSPSQWNAASIRIMYELLRTGKLSPSDTDAYLQYVTEANDLVSEYSWRSVITHNDAYRKQQAI